MSADKIKIPREYLPALRRMREGSIIPSDLAKVDEFIAAAEADRPPLPEGWVVYTPPSGKRRILWHENGALHIYDDGRSNEGVYIDVDYDRDRLTPLRPAVTEADVERAARAARAAYLGDADNNWYEVYQDIRNTWMKTARAALDTLGIEEVTS